MSDATEHFATQCIDSGSTDQYHSFVVKTWLCSTTASHRSIGKRRREGAKNANE